MEQDSSDHSCQCHQVQKREELRTDLLACGKNYLVVFATVQLPEAMSSGMFHEQIVCCICFVAILSSVDDLRFPRTFCLSVQDVY